LCSTWSPDAGCCAAGKARHGTRDPAATRPQYMQTEIERIAAQPVLGQLGILHVKVKQIAPMICRRVTTRMTVAAHGWTGHYS
jgi:hypothetical protein